MKPNGERTTENMTTCRKVTEEKVTVEKDGTGEERSTFDRRKDEGKTGSESRCVKREVNNRDDDKKKRCRKERENSEGGRGKVNEEVDAKRRSYCEAMIEWALRTERVFMGDFLL